MIDHDRIRRARSTKLEKIFGRGPQRTRSWLERRFLAGVRTARLPEPDMNAWMSFGGGEEWQVDALWRSHRLIVELDGGTHLTRRAFEEDRARDAVAQAAGYRAVRFTHRQLTEDRDSVISVLARLLRPAAE